MCAREHPDLSAPTFSFVVPLRNEAESLAAFHRQLHQAAEKLNEPYEIIFIDDGSTDGSDMVLRGLRSEDDHVRYVELSRSFGRRAAWMAGIDCATGLAVISLDCRCECTLELLGRLIEKWRQGYEVVYTAAAEAPPLPWPKRWADRILRRALRRASAPDAAEEACFRLLDRRAIVALRATRGSARLGRGLLEWMGLRQAVVPCEAQPGQAAGIRRSLGWMLGKAMGAVLSRSVLPLRFIGAAGLIMVAVALLYGLGALVCWPLIGVFPTANLLFLAAGLLGVKLAVLGVLGEYIERMRQEAWGRPVYVVREAVGFEAPEEEERPDAHRPAGEVLPREPSAIRFFT